MKVGKKVKAQGILSKHYLSFFYKIFGIKHNLYALMIQEYFKLVMHLSLRQEKLVLIVTPKTGQAHKNEITSPLLDAPRKSGKLHRENQQTKEAEPR